MQVNKRIYDLSKATTPEEYIAFLEFSCDIQRLQSKKGQEKIDEMNRQLDDKQFITI